MFGRPLIRLDAQIPNAERFLLRITAANDEIPGSPERLIVDQYEIRTHAPLPPYARPKLFVFFFGLTGAWFLLGVAGVVAKRRMLLWGIAALCLSLAFFFTERLTLEAERWLYRPWVPVAVGVVGLAPVWMLALRTQRWQEAVSCSCVILLLLAAWLRWLSWEGNAVPLYPDARYYQTVAMESRLLYDTGSREPLYIWILGGAFAALGPVEGAVRFTSLWIGVGFVYAVFALGRRLFGPAVALLGAAYLGLHPNLANLSVQGLRDELFAMLVALFLLIVLPPTDRWGPWLTAALACVTAAIFLTRLNTAASIAILFLFLKWQRKWPWSRIVLPIVVATALLFPYLGYWKKTFGDPFYSMNIYATGFRNMEFAGQPGFASKEAVEKNLFLGPNTTTFGYIFGLHSLKQVVIDVARGYWRCLFGYWASEPYFFSGPTRMGFALYLVGLPALLFRVRPRTGPVSSGRSPFSVKVDRVGWELWFSLCVFLGPLVFLAGVPTFYLDWRLVCFLLIGYALSVGAGLRMVARVGLALVWSVIPRNSIPVVGHLSQQKTRQQPE